MLGVSHHSMMYEIMRSSKSSFWICKPTLLSQHATRTFQCMGGPSLKAGALSSASPLESTPGFPNRPLARPPRLKMAASVHLSRYSSNVPYRRIDILIAVRMESSFLATSLGSRRNKPSSCSKKSLMGPYVDSGGVPLNAWNAPSSWYK